MSVPLPPRPDLAERGPQPVAEDRPRASWRAWEVVLFAILGLLAGAVVSYPLFPSLEPNLTGGTDAAGLLITVVFDAGWVGVLLLWLRLAHPGWPRILGWPPRGLVVRETAIGAGLGLLLYLASGLVGYLLALLLQLLSGDLVEPPVQVSDDLDGWGVALLFVVAVVVAPVAEEFIFRGLLFRAIADRYGFWTGAILSAVPFGLIHVAVGQALGLWLLRLTLVFVGIGLAWIHWRRRNLLANIVAHATFNVIGVAILLSDLQV